MTEYHRSKDAGAMTTPRHPLTILAVLAIVAVLAGCGEPIAAGDTTESAAGTAAPTVQDTDAEPSIDPDPLGDVEVPEPEPEPEAEVDPGGPVADFDVAIDGAKWSHDGIKLRATRLALLSIDNMCAGYTDVDFDQPGMCHDPDEYGETIVALDMRVVNDNSRDVDFYPDQSELVLGSEQLDSNIFESPADLGGTIREGTKRAGQVWWFSEQSVDDIAELGEMRLIVGGPVWPDDWEPVTGSYDDIDLTVHW